MVTMKDVARHAGVSTATVSAVLNGEKGQASAETTERVQRSMAELGYVANPMGRSLRKQEARMWTLTVPSIENPFIIQVIRGVEDVAMESGYSLLLGHTQDDPVRERKYLDLAASGLSDGVIIAPTTSSTDVADLLRRRVPVVSIVRELDATEPIDTVVMDNTTIARDATRFLLDRGRRRIGYVAGPKGMYADNKRLAGYKAELDSEGIAFDPELVAYTALAVEGGLEAVQRLYEVAAPDALIIANSLMTIGAVEAARRRGGGADSYPEIVAFDDAPWARPLLPFVHVMEQPAYELGRRAGEMLLTRIREPEAPIRTELLPAALREATVPAS